MVAALPSLYMSSCLAAPEVFLEILAVRLSALLHDVVKVRLDGSLRKYQLRRDLAIGLALDDEGKYFSLAL